MRQQQFIKNKQYYKFCLYGFLKNQRFFEPFLILFFLEKGLSFVQIGTLYAVREIATNILEIPTGFFSDAIGRRRTMMSSFFFYIVSFIVFYVFSSFWIYAAAMVFYAVGEAFRTGTHKAMIFTYLKNKGWSDQKVYYYGHTRSWSQMGSAISSLLAAGIVFISGNYKAIFLFSIIPYILDFLLIASYPKSLDGPINELKLSGLYSKFKKLFRSFLQTFKDPVTLKIVNNLSLHSGYFKATKDYLQPIIQTFALGLPLFLIYDDNKRSALVIGAAYFFIYLLTSFASRNAGRAASLFKNLQNPLNLTLTLGLLAGTICGTAYYFGIKGLAIAVFILVYIIENIRKPIGIGHFADKVGDNILAVALSAQSQISTLWAAVIAIGMGALVDWLGIGLGMAVASGGLLLLSRFLRLR